MWTQHERSGNAAVGTVRTAAGSNADFILSCSYRSYPALFNFLHCEFHCNHLQLYHNKIF